MKRVLFLDRDGTLILEPVIDQQVDSLEKLEFYPKVIRNLYRIVRELDFELVMVTNQDGLGTDSFPEHTFWPAHQKMLQTLEREGIRFEAVHIDKTFAHEQAPTRKPGTAMLHSYLSNPEYDLPNSFVIGDRLSDMELAYNLGAKGILIQDPSLGLDMPRREVEEKIELISPDWDEIFEYLATGEKLPGRSARIHRQTHETDIQLVLRLDGKGRADIHTGIGFLDHMLHQLARHSGCDLSIQAQGDLHIEAHHTIEDLGIALGEAFKQALGDKRGIRRYGHSLLPMDEALAQVALDFSGRAYLVWKASFKREMLGQMPTEMASHFFHSFAENARCTLNIQAEGENDHHILEAIFKGWAQAIRMAIALGSNPQDIPSTKGVLS